jgi:hypothetical protein
MAGKKNITQINDFNTPNYQALRLFFTRWQPLIYPLRAQAYSMASLTCAAIGSR